MNLVGVLVVVFFTVCVLVALYLEDRAKKKNEQMQLEEQKREQKQLELEQAITLDKKFEEDSKINVEFVEEEENIELNVSDMPGHIAVMTVGGIVNETLSMSEEDQTKLLMRLVSLDEEGYDKMIQTLEEYYAENS